MDKVLKVSYATDILIYSIDSRINDNCRGLPKKYFSILLVRREHEPFIGKWCLPGGYVKDNETSFEAAKRVLKKETNISNTYVEQLGIFDSVDRDPRGRTISSVYMALVDKNRIKDELSENSKWFDIALEENNGKIEILLEDEEKIEIIIEKEKVNKEANQYIYKLISQKNIAFDHGLIINKGIVELRRKAEQTDIIFNLMPKEFTVGELKQVYEIILGKKLINSAFRRVIAPKIEMVEEKIKTGGHRPSSLFRYIGDSEEDIW